jgi:aerobic carbon-monoxide dehydrogenase large subunit
MTDALESSAGLSALDRPNSYIGKTVPRPNLERLMQGRGLYVSDVELPRMAHVVFLRSPHAHAKIIAIDADAARRLPGVIAIVTGKELSAVITPWVGVRRPDTLPPGIRPATRSGRPGFADLPDQHYRAGAGR